MIKIFQLKGLKPKNKGHTDFYECCDLTKKVHLMLHTKIWSLNHQKVSEKILLRCQKIRLIGRENRNVQFSLFRWNFVILYFVPIYTFIVFECEMGWRIHSAQESLKKVQKAEVFWNCALFFPIFSAQCIYVVIFIEFVFFGEKTDLILVE